MKSNKTSSSKNNKQRKSKKLYELDREFIKLYHITNFISMPKYDAKELFQDGDFADQADADDAYEMNYVMPYIFYILSDAEYKTHKNHKIISVSNVLPSQQSVLHKLVKRRHVDIHK